MIIAIALNNNMLSSTVHLQFGRCTYFAIYDSELDTLRYLENTERNSTNDTGTTVASLLLLEGISTVVAGRFGMKAADSLRERHIQMIVPHQENTTLMDVLKKVIPDRRKQYKENEHENSSSSLRNKSF